MSIIKNCGPKLKSVFKTGETSYANKKESALGARSPCIHYSSSLMFIRAAHAALQFHCSKELIYSEPNNLMFMAQDRDVID